MLGYFYKLFEKLFNNVGLIPLADIDIHVICRVEVILQ